MPDAARAFVRFWYDFIVGDDPSIALAVLAGIGLTAAAHAVGEPAWWPLPVVVALAVGRSVWREASRQRQSGP